MRASWNSFNAKPFVLPVKYITQAKYLMLHQAFPIVAIHKYSELCMLYTLHNVIALNEKFQRCLKIRVCGLHNLYLLNCMQEAFGFLFLCIQQKCPTKWKRNWPIHERKNANEIYTFIFLPDIVYYNRTMIGFKAKTFFVHEICK